MRIFGLGARVMARIGAVPVLVPGSDLVQAFDKGKIDAAEVYTPAVDRTLGLQEEVKRLYMPGWHQPATVLEFLVNKDRWAALGPERQQLIETTCGERLQATLADMGGGSVSEAALYASAVVVLALVGLFATRSSGLELVLDLRTTPAVRRELAVVGLVLAIGAGVGVLTSATFQSRYAAVVVPLLLLAGARRIVRRPGPARPGRGRG